MLSNSIPNGTKLTLRVLDAKKGALKKRRTHPGGEQGGAKKLRSNTRDGEHRTCVLCTNQAAAPGCRRFCPRGISTLY